MTTSSTGGLGMPLKGAGYLRRLKTVPKAQYWQPHKEATSASCSPSWILPPALDCTSVSFPSPHCRLSIRCTLSPRSPFQTCSPVPDACRRSSTLTSPSSTLQTGLPLSSVVYSGTGVRDLRIPPPLNNLHLLVSAQCSQYLAYICLYFPLQHFPPLFRNKHNMVLAFPSRM